MVLRIKYCANPKGMNQKGQVVTNTLPSPPHLGDVQGQQWRGLMLMQREYFEGRCEDEDGWGNANQGLQKSRWGIYWCNQQ